MRRLITPLLLAAALASAGVQAASHAGLKPVTTNSGVLRFAAPDPVPPRVVLRLSRAGESRPRVYSWSMPSR
jgi:hypothetical protein